MERELNVWNIQEQLLKSRVIKLYGEVNDRIAYEINACLDVLSNDDPTAPIKLEINTPGGSVISGLAICDKIKSIPNPVIAFNLGSCMSMGTVISSACDFALAGRNTQFMIHEVSGGTEGKFRDQKVSLDFTETLNKRSFSILSKKTGKTYKELMKDAQHDFFMSAEEALKYHLIDGILKDSKKDLEYTTDFVKDLCE